MFAVPGWSLGAGGPKRDTASTKSKKRKDHEGADRLPKSPLASKEAAQREDFSRSKPSAKSSKKVAKNHQGNDAPDQSSSQTNETHASIPPSKRQKTRQDSKPQNELHQPSKRPKKQTEQDHGGKKSTEAPAASPLPGQTKLTPLQSAMQKKLLGARFRHLNESLYTTPSGDAVQLFEKNPDFYEEYHSGFRSQVSSWPENPVDTFVADLKRRSAIKPSKQSKFQDDKQVGEASLPPLPRSGGKCIVADLGCGDASLAHKVKQFSKKGNVEVKSFDLQSSSSLVTKADISALPLPDDSVNIAIFCLALMGTNWIDFVEEAWRVLHWKGELWVAEIKSRFGKPERKQKDAGKKEKAKKGGDSKKRKHQQDQDAAEGLIEDASGAQEGPGKTDVSAFITILKKRGFVMENERGADMSNKMFVRMRFIKAVNPIKGKHKAELPADATFAARDKAWRSLLREDEEIDEATVLQPCLYKTR